MAHKCYISFKTEDVDYKKYIQNTLNVDMIDKSLNESIDSFNEDYIMQKIRDEYLSDSTVTIFLIGKYSGEDRGAYEQRYIKRELQSSLYNGKNNTKSGILGIVLPSMYDSIFKGTCNCATCGGSHTTVKIDDATTIKEFSYNYYIPNDKCSWLEDDQYCILVKWSDFKANPNYYIDQAFDKRSHPIADKVKVYPK